MSEILATVNGVDITKYIIKDSYNVNSEAMYTSWQDANYVEHRAYIRDRVSGSFEIIVFGDTPRTALVDFLDILKGATVNNVITIGLYVANEGTFQAINAYYSVEMTQHAETTEGKYVDRAMIRIEER